MNLVAECITKKYNYCREETGEFQIIMQSLEQGFPPTLSENWDLTKSIILDIVVEDGSTYECLINEKYDCFHSRGGRNFIHVEKCYEFITNCLEETNKFSVDIELCDEEILFIKFKYSDTFDIMYSLECKLI